MWDAIGTEESALALTDTNVCRELEVLAGTLERKNPNLLYRSSGDSLALGVFGGIGEYYGFDPWVLRVVALCFFLMTGVGALLYLILAACMRSPVEDPPVVRQALKEAWEEVNQNMVN